MTVLVVGGGVAGGAAACLLGSRAVLIERETGPHHKVCGEFVSWEAQDALRALGLDLDALGGAPIPGVRLLHGARAVTVPLPRPGLGLSRQLLDEALLAAATARGATVLRGRTVRHVAADGAEVDGLGRVAASRVLLATGKHEMRGLRRAATAESLVGLKMHLQLSPAEMAALGGHVEVILFPGGYAGLQPIEGGRANLCLLMRRPVFEAAGAGWDGAVTHMRRHCAVLDRRLHGATTLWPRPAAIFRVPYGHVHGDDAPLPEVFRLGDQMGVIPSFSGDGMAIALHTAFAAARAEDAAAYHKAMRRDLHGQIGRAMLLHRLGQAVPGGVTAAARLWPGALRWIARLTRVDGVAWG